MDIRQGMDMLAQAYWGREASDAELVAMAGEVARDSARLAPRQPGKGSDLFNVEPAHFDAVLLGEANP